MSYYQGLGSQLRADERKMNVCKQHLEECVYKMTLNLKDPIQKELWNKMMAAMEFCESTSIALEDQYNSNI